MKRELPNSFEFDPSKPLEIAYGTYPHRQSGRNQVVNAQSVAAITQQLEAARAAGAPGLPVYVGHPDVRDLAPKYPDKSAHGWIVAITASDAGFNMQPEWVKEPSPGEFIYFSPYFLGTDLDASNTLIDEMRSVGLTNSPNSTKFRLPNEAGDNKDDNKANTDQDGSSRPAAKGTKPMNKILALLGLPETATEDEAVTALNALIAERDDLKRKLEEAQAEASKASTDATEAKTDMANERAAHVGLLLDCAMRDGKVTPATKPVWEGRLKRDFANESIALAKACATIKTRSELPNEASEDGVLARYEALPPGNDKRKFLKENAAAIHNARAQLA